MWGCNICRKKSKPSYGQPEFEISEYWHQYFDLSLKVSEEDSERVRKWESQRVFQCLGAHIVYSPSDQHKNTTFENLENKWQEGLVLSTNFIVSSVKPYQSIKNFKY